MARKKIAIIGAGLAGLSAAYALQSRGLDCDIFEQEACIGGLCRTHQKQGFSFDCGGHLLHFKHGDTARFVRRLLRGLKVHDRSAWIYAFGSFVPYPFQANLYALPDRVRRQCLDSFLRAKRNKRFADLSRDFRSWIVDTFGEGIARYFMIPYNHKFWTMPPQRLTCEWLDGFVPVPSISQVIAGASHQGRTQFGYNSKFLYPACGGIQQLPEALAAGLHNIHCDSRVRQVDLESKTLTLAGGRTIHYDRLITTVALPALPALMPGLTPAVRRACKQLRWNSILNMNIGFSGSGSDRKHWVYVPQKDLSFFRVGFFHHFSRSLVPQGKSSLYAEVAYAPGNPPEKSGLARRIVTDLRKAGILKKKDRLICSQINDIRYGYPIYDRHYARARGLTLDYLERRDVISCGRYGGWRYMSMEQAMRDGFLAARKVL